MSVVLRYLSHEEAEILARTVVTRYAVKGRIEVHGLSWKSDALLEWENRQRDMGIDPKVDVRIDELDLSVVYVDAPDRSVGPFKAVSRQPMFTDGLSLFELNRLKDSVKDKALADRIGRLEDKDAMDLRLEFHEKLGHGKDPVALKRLSDKQNEMARLRLELVPDNEEDTTDQDSMRLEPKPAQKIPDRRKTKQKKVTHTASPSAVSNPVASPTASDDTPATVSSTPTRKSGDLPHAKHKTIQLKRRPT